MLASKSLSENMQQNTDKKPMNKNKQAHLFHSDHSLIYAKIYFKIGSFPWRNSL